MDPCRRPRVVYVKFSKFDHGVGLSHPLGAAVARLLKASASIGDHPRLGERAALSLGHHPKARSGGLDSAPDNGRSAEDVPMLPWNVGGGAGQPNYPGEFISILKVRRSIGLLRYLEQRIPCCVGWKLGGLLVVYAADSQRTWPTGRNRALAFSRCTFHRMSASSTGFSSETS